ncbi:hypothetical protein IT417_02210 [bacterium]|nr:hypothetical protein [bacterium]
MPLIIHLSIFLFSFVGIWIGSGLAVKSVENIAKSLKVSSFLISFLVLGFFTSITELSVGYNSIIENDPEIFVGNVIGASIVLCMLIVPLLALVGNSIRITPEFQGFNLPASLVVIASPVILVMDGIVTAQDSLISLALFGFLVICIQSKKGLIEKFQNIQRNRIKTGKELLKILFGIAVIFTASHFVVEETLYFSNLLQISPFLISLLLISVGTNVPELSLVVRSAFMRNHQIAFGDYVGSAAFNTFLLGALTFYYGKPILLSNNYSISLLFLTVGLLLFYYFARTKNTISRLEGFILLLLYLTFLAVEILGNIH